MQTPAVITLQIAYSTGDMAGELKPTRMKIISRIKRHCSGGVFPHRGVIHVRH